MNLTPFAFGREYNYPFKVCKQTLVIYLVVFGYIAGLLLHLIGLLLFFLFFVADYKRGTLQRFLVKVGDSIVRWMPLLKVKNIDSMVTMKEGLTKLMSKKFNIQVEENRLGLFSIADTFVASQPFAERDILSAKEGVFRSLAVLVIIEALYLSIFVFPLHKL
jgi:hypothetical protein